MYPSDNLDNFPCTFCVPLSNLVIFDVPLLYLQNLSFISLYLLSAYVELSHFTLYLFST